MTTFSPREIVSELDRYIVGQNDAKRAVAIALRNRWRRQQLEGPLREEVLPKNILMIGPTGCGKTEISRRLAKLAGAPFLKVEATKFTEVGYVGRDVEQIVRDLVEIGIGLVQGREAQGRSQAKAASRRRGARARRAGRRRPPAPATREAFRRKLRAERARRQGDRDRDAGRRRAGLPMFEIPGMPGASIGAINLGDMLGKAFGGRSASRAAPPCSEAYEPLIAEESDKLLDQDAIVQEAIRAGREQRHRLPRRDRQDLRPRGPRAAADVSREGVQRDLLPLIEGTTVATKHGAGEDRPHPVHRVRRLPRLEAVRPAARAAGPAADPRRAAAARPSRISAAS